MPSRRRNKVSRNDPCPCGSGKKYKKCCLSKRERIIEMVDPASVSIKTMLPAAFAEAERESSSPISDANLLLGDGEHLEKGEGCRLLEEVMATTEEAIKELASSHTVLFWISVLRRLPSVFSTRYEQTRTNILVTTQLACAKYGASAVSREFGEIPRAEGRSGWTSARRQVPHVTSADLAHALTILRLCEAYYGLTATYRRIGKGFRYKVTGGELLELPADPALTGLVNLYDRRQDKFATAFASAGLFLPEDQMRWTGKHPRIMTVGPALTPPRDGKIKLAGNQVILTPPYEARFGLGSDDLDAIWPYLEIIRDPFERRYGISPMDAILCLSALSFVWSGQARTDPLGLIQVITRGGCVLSEQNLKEYLIGSIPAISEFHYRTRINSERATLIVEHFLRLAWVVPASIDLQLRQPVGLIFGRGQGVFVDLTLAHAFLDRIIAGIELAAEDKETKARMFELEVETYLSGCGNTVFRSQDGRTAKTFMRKKSALGQADCSRICGSVLVLIDAKSYKIPPAYDRGEYSAVQTRVEYLRSWVEQAERLADNLKDNPIGSNYDLRALNVTHVLTIVCTPYTEYIPEQDSRFFLTRDTPRICTPHELRTYLLEQHPESLAKNPNSRRLANSA